MLSSETTSFRILVCGSRGWQDIGLIRDVLSDYAHCEGVTIIHGTAQGADRIAGKIAHDLGFAVEEHPADWSVKPDTPPHRVKTRPDGTQYDVAAGFERNAQMLDTGPDQVIAFTQGGSPGTQNTIDEARKRGIPVRVEGTPQLMDCEAR